MIDQIKAAITSTKALNGQPTNVILASDSADEVVPLVDRHQLIYSQFVFSFFLSNPGSFIDMFHLVPQASLASKSPDLAATWPPLWHRLGKSRLCPLYLKEAKYCLLVYLLIALIPIVIGLVTALIPLVSGLLAVASSVFLL